LDILLLSAATSRHRRAMRRELLKRELFGGRIRPLGEWSLFKAAAGLRVGRRLLLPRDPPSAEIAMATPLERVLENTASPTNAPSMASMGSPLRECR